jgi:hypothetical protein
MGVGDQRHAPAALPAVKTRCPLYRRLGGPQSRSGRVRKISLSPRFDPRTAQPVASRYTDWTIPAHYNKYEKEQMDRRKKDGTEDMTSNVRQNLLRYLSQQLQRAQPLQERCAQYRSDVYVTMLQKITCSSTAGRCDLSSASARHKVSVCVVVLRCQSGEQTLHMKF